MVPHVWKVQSVPCHVRQPLCIEVFLINLKISVIKTICMNGYNILKMLYHLGWDPNRRRTLNAILLCRSHLSTATANVKPPIPNIDESCNNKIHTKWVTVFIPKLCKNIQNFKEKIRLKRVNSYNYRVCQRLTTGRWFRPGPSETPPIQLTAPRYSWNIVVKVPLNAILL